MSHLPRLAIGAAGPNIDPAPLTWALANLFQREGRQVQVFHDQARFQGEAGKAICGQGARYLDSWLMSPSLCTESFLHGSAGSDLSLVTGRFDRRAGSEGCLAELSGWLGLPRVAIVDVPSLAECRLPALPAGTAAVLLDRVRAADVPRWQTVLSSLWGVPVLGGLPELPLARRLVSRPAGEAGPTSCEVCSVLGDALARTASFAKLSQLAEQTPPLTSDSHRLASDSHSSASESHVYSPSDNLAGLHVAVAYDEAIHCYFPDVLDLLELHGACVQLFSPLRDEKLPECAEVVYFGCGHPERFARELSENFCMTMALRQHACQGKRMFAEAGGLAYLCQQAILPDGTALPMAGVLPAIARMQSAGEAEPVEVTWARDHWLGFAGERIRGYRNPAWRIEPLPTLEGLLSEPGREMLVVGRRAVVGSELHVNFAAQPHFARRFAPPVSRSARV